MKDESAFLQPNEAPAYDPTIVHLPLYRAGTRVAYQNQTYTVSHVVLSHGSLLVHLQELGASVDSAKIRLAPTRLVLQRN